MRRPCQGRSGGQFPTAARLPSFLGDASGSLLPGLRLLDNCPRARVRDRTPKGETRSTRLGWRPLDGRNESPDPAQPGDAQSNKLERVLLGRRSCAMGRPTISTRAASICQKLASAIAILAVAMFVTHAAAAQGAVSHVHDHTLAHAGALLIAGDAFSAELSSSHKHSSVVGHKHDATEEGTPPCCGDACLLALVPDDNPPLDESWSIRSKPLKVASSLAGHDPEGLRRPPRLPYRI